MGSCFSLSVAIALEYNKITCSSCKKVLRKKYDKYIGYHVIEPNYKLVIDKIKSGYDFIAFSLDTLFLGKIAEKQMNLLKENFKKL